MFLILDIDECSAENKCVENSECVNTPGSYACACLGGFEGKADVECKGTLLIAYSLLV